MASDLANQSFCRYTRPISIAPGVFMHMQCSRYQHEGNGNHRVSLAMGVIVYFETEPEPEVEDEAATKPE